MDAGGPGEHELTHLALELECWVSNNYLHGLNTNRGTICSLTEKTPFLYRYFEVLGQKISCQGF